MCFFRCRLKCTEKFCEEEKKSIFESLYSGKPKNEQDTFLMGLIDAKEVRRRRSRNEEPKQERRSNFVFHILNGKERVQVCKKAFLSLYALSVKAVFRLTSLLLNGDRPTDRRGQHLKRGNALPDSAILKINEHLRKFPKKETHYGSKPLTYLDASLTVKKMYEMFCSENTDLKKIIKYEYYLKHFNENFGYRFGRPQVDVCQKCEELGVKLKSKELNDTAKRVAAAELLVHKRKAAKFYNKIKCVKDLCDNNEHVEAIVFDYMQNLPLPFMPVNDVFYLRKVWQYVFEIHDIKTNAATFYTYHEGTAKRGPNEVASFLEDYIKQIPDNVTELHVFSDAAGGQNRNHTLIRFFLNLTMNGRFTVIHQYFPIRGHSFLPCDRDFGLIKRAIRRHDRIYTPMQYVSIIANAKRSTPRFTVKVVETHEVLDFKAWWPVYFKKTAKEVAVTKQKLKESFSIAKYKHFTYARESPGFLVAREFIDGLSSFKFHLSKNVASPPFPNERAYEEKVPIKTKKLEDLMKVLTYIPEEEQEFFEQFKEWPTTSREYDSD